MATSEKPRVAKSRAAAATRSACTCSAGLLVRRRRWGAFAITRTSTGIGAGLARRLAECGDFTDQDPGHEIDMVRLDCEAVLGLTAAYAPGFEKEPGAMLIVACASGFAPIPRQATYAATKALALSLAEALHFELRPTGTSVTAPCPGPVSTEIAEGLPDASGPVRACTEIRGHLR
ncbi:MAG TPA: SDR family NAD(P)-dependent oxidoreductase [Spirillospora sp.]|nr:SDR family NAD(P)-dependent oxidoreductase [Spirillospora sp.]